MWLWLWLLLAVALTATVVWLIVRGAGGRHRSSSPEQILGRRYASGEIGRDEYERRLAGLRR